MTRTASRRVLVTVVTVWLTGLLLVLGLWQRVDAACTDRAHDGATIDCASATSAR